MSPVRRFGPVVLFACAILAMSGPWAAGEHTGALAQPWLEALGLSPEAAEIAHKVLRKVGHFTAYGAFAWVAFRAVRGDRPPSPHNVARAWALALALASIDETLQWLSPERGGSAWDVALDGAGAATVLALVVWRLLRARRAAPAPTVAATEPGR